MIKVLFTEHSHLGYGKKGGDLMKFSWTLFKKIYIYIYITPHAVIQNEAFFYYHIYHHNIANNKKMLLIISDALLRWFKEIYSDELYM